MKPLKPWCSFADQLQHLQDRGLQVDNPVAALDYLERLGYYRLSGYWWPAALNRAKPFFYFCLMQQLLRVICPNSSWGQRFKNLLADEFPVVDDQTISLLELGAFPGWEGWVLWPQP